MFGKNSVCIVTPSENEALIHVLLEDPPADWLGIWWEAGS